MSEPGAGAGVADWDNDVADEELTPRVTLADGDDASGMANMLAGLMRDNVRDFPVRSRVASVARGKVVLTASDRNLSVTLSFVPGEIRVSNGCAPGAPVLAGPWMEMTKLCSGQSSPMAAIARRQIRVVPGRGMAVVPAAAFVLSVPASFYGDNSQQKKRLIVGGAAATAAIGLGVVVIARRRRRRSS